jgi:hypothetical protein
MNAQIARQIAQLHELTTKQLRGKYQELFGSESRTRNRQFLFRRIAWRLQALAGGDLSERARERARQLACDADLKLRPPRRFHAFTMEQAKRDWRLPEMGSTLRRAHQQKLHHVQVCPDGFLYESKKYRSLSAVAFAITGTRWNGYAFFGLQEKKHG